MSIQITNSKKLTEQLIANSGVDFSNFKFQIKAVPSFDSCKLLSYEVNKSSGYYDSNRNDKE
jgi:hypothetical protein